MRVDIVGALVVLHSTCISPDVNVLDRDVGARHACWAVDVDWWSLGAIRTITGPVRESDAVVEDPVSGLHGLATPVAVDVEGVGVLVADEVI